MPQKKIILANQKGGVGKTTLTFNLGVYLAHIGRRTLLIDTDPQGNLSRSLTDDTDTDPGLYEALSAGCFELKVITPTLSLLAGGIKLALLEKSLIGELDAYTRLKELLEEQPFKEFEYILIDSPPSLGVLTVNALTAAQYLVVPMTPGLYTLQGTNDLMATVSKVRKNLNPDLTLAGVIINAFDSIPVITRQIREEIRSSFTDKVFSTSLSKSIKIEEAIASKSGLVNLKTGKVKEEIRLIGEELIFRVQDSGLMDELKNAGNSEKDVLPSHKEIIA